MVIALREDVERPDISIIVVHLSGVEMLMNCLESVYGQGRPSLLFETIVVFNGSKDGSIQACEQRFPQKIKRIELPSNRGFNVGNNIGIRQATGKNVLLLNNDTIVLPGAIDRLWQYMESDEAAGIVAPKLLYLDGSLQRACHKFPSLQGLLSNAFFLNRLFPRSSRFGWTNMTYWGYNDTRFVEWVSAACVLIRRQALADVGLLDEKSLIAGDFDLCWRFRQRGWQTVFVHDATIIHLLGQSSWRKRGADAICSRMNSFVLNYEAMYYWYYDHFGRESAARFAWIAKLDALLRLPIFFALSIIPYSERESAVARLWASTKILFRPLWELEADYLQKNALSQARAYKTRR